MTQFHEILAKLKRVYNMAPMWAIVLLLDVSIILLAYSSGVFYSNKLIIVLAIIIYFIHHCIIFYIYMQKERIRCTSAGILHDLNNILSVIIGCCDILRLQPNSDSDKRVNQISDNAGKAGKLAARMLATLQSKEYSWVNPQETIEYIYKSVEVIIGKGVNLKVSIDSNLDLVRCDMLSLERAIINLIINSNKSLKQRGWIEIVVMNRVITDDDSGVTGYYSPRRQRTVKQGRYLDITVSDNGSGIREDLYEAIFDPFFTTAMGMDSSGLGLWTVFEMVKKERGYILFNSELGFGSSFKILIPSKKNMISPE